MTATLNQVLFSNLQVYVRGEQKTWKAAEGNWVGLADGSTGLFYPDGIVESCFQKLILCRNGRKNERTANITKLENGFLLGNGPILQAARWIAAVDSKKRMAFTGAGISAESGVPTYRDPGGLWEFYNPKEVSSIKGFALDPRKVWAFEVEFYKMLAKVKCNPGHKALSDLQCNIVTQNVDGLHQSAGSEKVIEVHGSEVRAVCLRCKKTTCMEKVVSEIIGQKNTPLRFRLKNNMEGFIAEVEDVPLKAKEDEDDPSKSTIAGSSASSSQAPSDTEGKKTALTTANLAALEATTKTTKDAKATAKKTKEKSPSSDSSSVASVLFGPAKKKKIRRTANRAKSGDFDRLHSNPHLSEQVKKELLTYVIRCRKKTEKSKHKKKKKGAAQAKAGSKAEEGADDGEDETDGADEGKEGDSAQDGRSSSSVSSDGEGSLRGELVKMGLLQASSGSGSSSESSSDSSVSTTLSQFRIKNGPRITEVPLCPHCTGQDGALVSARESNKPESDKPESDKPESDKPESNGASVKAKKSKVRGEVGILKPDGIYFGESLEREVLRNAIRTAMNSHVVLMVGTTGKVDPARQMPLLARAHNRAKVIEVNPNATLLSRCAQLVIREPGALVLPKIAREVERIQRSRAE